MTIDKESLPPIYLGCPVWTHPSWKRTWYTANATNTGLAHYASECNSVEGNTTFYQTPDKERAMLWSQSVPSPFKFCFKLPSRITHDLSLQNANEDLAAFWHKMQPLHANIGILMAQLPSSFGPQKLATLSEFLDSYTLPVALAVEVRHPAFFAKQNDEKQLNQLLIKHEVNRVIMDTRALFANSPKTELEQDVQRKKPKVPVNVIATAHSPVVRFVGGNDEQVTRQKMQPWIHKCHSWREQGKTPYVFVHCIDNAESPFLLDTFINLYNQHYPDAEIPRLTLQGGASSEQISLL